MSELYYHFYNFFKRLDPHACETVWLSGAFTVQLSQEGHSCLPLSKYTGKKLFDDDADLSMPKVKMSGLEDWRRQLVASKLVGAPQESVTPLILDEGNRVYLSRNYDYETRLAHEILQRVSLEGHSVDKVASALQILFGDNKTKEVDWQKIAVATAALRKLCIVSGGPGTGKTFTVVKIMALLQMLAPQSSIRFGLATPTGKAASRLQESIQASVQKLPKELVAQLEHGIEAQTIHRLLGTKRHSPYFKHTKDNPLALDVLIVDEVSMVDLAMMVKLLEAMPESGRVILLGDKDQLSSVEAGRVLADICEVNGKGFSPGFVEQLTQAGAVSEDIIIVDLEAAPIRDCLVFLEKSYRFGDKSPIGRLARTVLVGNVNEASRCLAEENTIVEGGSLNRNSADLATKICVGYRACLTEKQPAKALDLLKCFRLLCAHRQGVWGVEQVNQWVEMVLIKENLIEKQGEWYSGRPVMITGNHYALRLFNGDIGLVMHDQQGRLRVWFEASTGGVRSLSPSRIPAHETAFALTVHKSQGSEFDNVILALPEQSSRLITRELLYTAITRAKKSFELWGDMEVFKEGVKKTTQRNTGLSDKLF